MNRDSRGAALLNTTLPVYYSSRLKFSREQAFRVKNVIVNKEPLTNHFIPFAYLNRSCT